MRKPPARLRKGFTLVEVMIVVLLIGILLSIAVPQFLHARATAQSKTCRANLKQIETAKHQWAVDQKIGEGTPAITDLAPTYVRTTPTCPSGGTYTIGSLLEIPVCSYSTTDSQHGLF